MVVSTCLRNDLHAFKINSSDILFHSSSIAVLSEPIFGREVAFVLFCLLKYPYSIIKGLWSGLKSCLIAVLTVFLWTFNSLACFLIDVVGSFLITLVRIVKKPSFRFLFNPSFPLFLKKLFFCKNFPLLFIQETKKLWLVSALRKS